MELRIGSTAPDFEADTTKGHIRLYDWAGDNWIFFFSHPADFTPVCTTELGRIAHLMDAFERRGVKPIGLSTDTVHEHFKWIVDVNDTQDVTVKFPIIADPDLKIAQLYDMIHPDESDMETIRSVFIIDPSRKVRLTMNYPLSIGRNFDEVLRAIDALQTSDAKNIVTPSDWKPGGRIIIPPSVPNHEAEMLYPEGWEEQRPYLRLARLDQRAN